MYSQFINRYPVSKTLRFELIPQGRTLEYIERDGIIAEGERRARSYQKVKKIIDKYHKTFIDNALQEAELSGTQEYFDLYKKPNRSDKENKAFEKCEENLRKEVVNFLKAQDGWRTLFKKELITEILPELVEDDESKNILGEFKKFTTYFTGFHDNRKNMYSAEAKSTAIAFRLINQNLPKFIDNMAIAGKVCNMLPKDIEVAEIELQEILDGKTIKDFFDVDNYSAFLTQKGIDRYNQVIGGISVNEKTKIKGINEYINLHNQTAEKSNRIGKLKPLFKQILSDRGTASFIPEKYESDQELLDSIKEFIDITKPSVDVLITLLGSISDYNSNGIYISNKHNAIETISQGLFGSWDYILGHLRTDFDNNSTDKNKTSEKYIEKREKYIRNTKSYSIYQLNSILEKKSIDDYFAGEHKELIWDEIALAEDGLKKLFEEPYPDDRSLIKDADSTFRIKRYLDALKELQRFVLPLLGADNESAKDERFYGEFTAAYEALDLITPLYNKVRNYMTAKPYSLEKVKLNFENSTLLDGWDLNKEKDNASVILMKDGLYYLGIMSKGNYRVFENLDESEDHEKAYQKMEYKLLPGANKMLPKVFLSKKGIESYEPSETVLEKYKKGTHIKSGEDNFSLRDCHNLIDFFKQSIEKHPDWKKFEFEFSKTEEYKDISGFYREVEDQGYKVSFKDIDESIIENYVDKGQLYLFQIYNKDFSPYSKGTPNLHTLYWEMLFDERNLVNPVYKLNGQAEVFYRKASIKKDEAVIHPANQPIDNKNKDNAKVESCFDYDIIKNKRFTVDKFQFHVPITMNFQAHGGSFINEDVRLALKENKKPYVIGVDRGERNLLYICVIDSNGNIVEQISLNKIINHYNGNTYKTDYHALLEEKEKERDLARKNWKTIANIKELKEGYLSQVVHLLASIMVKYNAIIVLEDLNMGFMRGRQKVEKQVYQKFEKMLIDKLNYLVDKKAPVEEDGGLLKAYQLSNKFESFQKLGKQSGMLFYTQAWNTSKIDPVTGFVNLFDTRYKNIESTKAFWRSFESIKYNETEEYFEFAFDYSKFTHKAEGSRTNWTVCSFGDRIRTFRNADKNGQWDSEGILITEEFIKLFNKFEIDYKTGNLINEIVGINDSSFHRELLALFRLTLQIRNSVTGTEIDYLLSPVSDDKGAFFDSRTAGEKMPKDADANGAYNIARKGLWIIEQIKKTPDKDMRKVNLAISNKEWLRYAQSK